MRWLRLFRDNWTLGAAALLIMAASAAAFALVAWLVLLAVSVAFGLDEAALNDWLMISAVVWLPLSVGAVVPGLRTLGAGSGRDETKVGLA